MDTHGHQRLLKWVAVAETAQSHDCVLFSYEFSLLVITCLNTFYSQICVSWKARLVDRCTSSIGVLWRNFSLCIQKSSNSRHFVRQAIDTLCCQVYQLATDSFWLFCNLYKPLLGNSLILRELTRRCHIRPFNLWLRTNYEHNFDIWSGMGRCCIMGLGALREWRPTRAKTSVFACSALTWIWNGCPDQLLASLSLNLIRYTVEVYPPPLHYIWMDMARVQFYFMSIHLQYLNSTFHLFLSSPFYVHPILTNLPTQGQCFLRVQQTMDEVKT